MIARVVFPWRVAAALLFALVATPAFATGPQVLFLRGGEIWQAEGDGRGAAPVTKTGGKVEAFEPSRDGRYLAYEQVVGFVDDPGENGCLCNETRGAATTRAAGRDRLRGVRPLLDNAGLDTGSRPGQRASLRARGSWVAR